MQLKNSREKFREVHGKLKKKKKEFLNCEESLKRLELNKEDLENEKKSWLERRKEADAELKRIEDAMNECVERTKSLVETKKEASDEINRTEDSLKSLLSHMYVESTKDLFGLLELEPRDENKKVIDFMVKSIEEKEAELVCPVCLETAEAPIFMCSQQHLICSSCQPRLTSCPECREAYQGPPRRHRYAERDAEELRNMQEELVKIMS